ncbi:hypothetical protein [uncultured Gammaproteobacteria bacterium]|nr:hypothetical protein [uncultured Gammaproteobacteria bacterium]
MIVKLKAGELYPIEVNYFERGGSAGLILYYKDSENRRNSAIPSSLLLTKTLSFRQ